MYIAAAGYHLLPRNVPADETTKMVKCYICDNWYHCSCVNLSDEQVKQLKAFWMCGYKGFSNTFNDLFSSDSD